jgi:hypothetical protein
VVIVSAAALVVAPALLAQATTPDTRVSVGSPHAPFSQNKQNEPALAIDPINNNLVVSGSNDEIDMEGCAAGDPTTCPFTPGVGVSGFYYSADSGASWEQPSYTGWTARGCVGPAACQPVVGSIGTLPNYYQAGLVSDGDPQLAFGPKPGANGKFSWSNGERLYYANLTSNFPGRKTFTGFEAVAVSRTDDLATVANKGGAPSWSNPVIVSHQNSALFSDKEALWADNASSSPYFGNAYICNTSFRSQEKGHGVPEPILFYTSHDGGVSWTNPSALTAATGNGQNGGRQDCTVRTDSHGTVYVAWDGFAGNTGQSVMFLATSSNGGHNFTRPRVIASFTPCGLPDPTEPGYVSFDGVAGARTSSMPSLDIANGAPTGSHATNELVMTYCDGATPTSAQAPNEAAQVRYSTDGGRSWPSGGNAAPNEDRPDMPAIAIAPDGGQIYLTYNNFTTPWQSTTADPRPEQGVVRATAVTTSGAPGPWTDDHRGAFGDARGSSANSLTGEFLGDYNSAAAADSYGAAVWNDVRTAADCPAVDSYRQQLAAGSTTATAPDMTACSTAGFGDSDIFGDTYPAGP